MCALMDLVWYAGEVWTGLVKLVHKEGKHVRFTWAFLFQALVKFWGVSCLLLVRVYEIKISLAFE
jgi:hypothetical protein